MKKAFSKTATPSSYEAGKRALADLKIPYTEQSDGTLLVEENIDLSDRNLKALPDLSCVILTESFDCSYNQLTTLEGAPQSIGKGLWCQNNQLTTLEGAPQYVRGEFWCNDNQLTSLKGAPEYVMGGFWCQNNQLTTLEGAPQAVGGEFWCKNNYLITLEGVAKTFEELSSDFGEFSSWNAIPEELRTPSGTQVQTNKTIKKIIHSEQRIPCKPPLQVIRKKRNDK